MLGLKLGGERVAGEGGAGGAGDAGGGPLHFIHYVYHGVTAAGFGLSEQASKRSVEDLKWCSDDLAAVLVL